MKIVKKMNGPVVRYTKRTCSPVKKKGTKITGGPIYYKQCFFWTEARLLFTHHEKVGSKFACMLLRYTSMKSFRKKIPTLQQLMSFSQRTEIVS